VCERPVAQPATQLPEVETALLDDESEDRAGDEIQRGGQRERRQQAPGTELA
jgi:hypothetical protein